MNQQQSQGNLLSRQQQIAQILWQIFLQQRSINPSIIIPRNVTDFKRNSAWVNLLKNNNIGVNELNSAIYNEVLNQYNTTYNQQAAQQQTNNRGQQKPNYVQSQQSNNVSNNSSGYNPTSQQSSFLSGSQSLRLKNVGGNSLQTFWANFRDYDQGTKTSTGINSVSKGTANDVKMPGLKAITSQMLTRKPDNKLPSWVQGQRKDVNSTNWASIPGAKFEGGKWRSKFFKAPPNAKQLQAQQKKKMQLLGTYAGTQSATQNFIFPLVQLLNKALTGNGYQTMGAISAKGVPLYIGRFYDPVTKRIKTISKPKISVNPYDWNQVYNKNILQMAANWNQFVRSSQRLTSLIRNKNDWGSIVQKKKLNNTLQNRRYSQMVATMRKIYDGTFLPFKSATAQQQTAMKKAIQDWSFGDLATLIQQVSQAKIDDAQTSAADKIRWGSYLRWRQNPVYAYGMENSLGSLQVPTVIKPGVFRQALKNDKQFKTLVAKTDMKSYLAKASRRGVKRKPMLSVAQINKLATVYKNSRPGVLVDVTLAKKSKMDSPLPQISKNQLKSMYDQVTNQQSSSLSQQPQMRIIQTPISGGNAGSLFNMGLGGNNIMAQ